MGRYVIEEWARIPCEPDIASEWIYRNPVLSKDTLVVGISQSGESRDTVQAVRLAREGGAPTVAITNLMGTQITREVDRVVYTRAGLETAVPLPRPSPQQVTIFYLLALKLAQVRKTMPKTEIEALLAEVRSLPAKAATYLDGDHPIEEMAQRRQKPFFLSLGRHIGLPVALEGALKLKEISYIHAEAYSSAEMKHGPIAMIDEKTPVFVIASDARYEKAISNLQEIRARKGRSSPSPPKGTRTSRRKRTTSSTFPRAVPPAAAHRNPTAAPRLPHRPVRGLDVDQPRNLAKTVTVE